jgi:hypothetical protein
VLEPITIFLLPVPPLHCTIRSAGNFNGDYSSITGESKDWILQDDPPALQGPRHTIETASSTTFPTENNSSSLIIDSKFNPAFNAEASLVRRLGVQAAKLST